MRRLTLAAGLLVFALSDAGPARKILDAFEEISGWTAAPSEGVRLALSSEAGEGTGRALRLNFDFQGRAGWAAARKEVPLHLPENWALVIRLRGEAPPETLEVKLLDRGGQNVWWSVRRNFEFPRDWKTLRIRKRQVSFAWGPARGGDIREVGSIEIAITAGSGGKGWVAIGELALEELPPQEGMLPTFGAWKSDPSAGDRQELVLDLGGRRELGGLVLDWDAEDFPRRYAVEISDDRVVWSTVRSISSSRGGRAWIYSPETEAAFLRLRLEESARGRGYRLRAMALEPPAFSETPTKFLESVAHDAPRREWPRSFRGEQLYWTLVGTDGGREKGLLSEDGALETGRGAFSLEPFLRVGGELIGWADARIEQTLADGDLPIPSVTRRHAGGLSLEVTALADGPSEAPTLRARYRLRNDGKAAARATLYLALRPMQVNPPWQFLNLPGGFAPILGVAWDGRAAHVDGGRDVVPLTAPSGFGATSFDDNEIVSWLARGALPLRASAADAGGFASAAFAWDLEIPPGNARDALVAVPLEGARPPEWPVGPAEASRDFEARLSAARRSWREKLDRVSFALPPSAEPAARTLRSNLGWILVNRDGAALQPGSRSYARSWIRDGALMSSALLALGHAEEVRDYLRWYAPFLLESGAVPCCVDRRGADPVPENDSHGELIYLAAEYFRLTGDRETIEKAWPYLSRAASHIDALREERRTAEFRVGEKRLFFGLLPESISHEGYSDHPVHSYWDDFWGVRGLTDAAELAAALGRAEEARRFSASRDQMRADLHTSIRAVIAARGIDYIPGSADLGDLDPTSTTIALEPCGEESRLPRPELERTFERYWEGFIARRAAHKEDKEYTPYEWRIVGSLLRLGWKGQAEQLFDALMADRRPPAWNHWAEVVWPDMRAAKFIGDMPHGWVGSDFMRSFVDRFAYDREEDGALVLAAGVPEAWLRDPRGVSVAKLATRYGRLDLTLRAEGSALRVRISGDLRVPRGGFALRSPLEGALSSATVNGKPAAVSRDGELIARTVPAEIILGSGL